MDKVRRPVLVLNQDYRPVNICQARRAIVLMMRGKAEMVEKDSGELRSLHYTIPIPSVIHLRALVKRPHSTRKVTRMEVFSRDRYICQYCGKQPKVLTLDHVVPRHRGGEHTWDNVVSCCEACNCRKAGRTPREARMSLVRQPVAPRDGSFFIPYQHLYAHSEWHKFLPKGTIHQ